VNEIPLLLKRDRNDIGFKETRGMKQRAITAARRFIPQNIFLSACHPERSVSEVKDLLIINAQIKLCVLNSVLSAK
jgi:hypothetical protein